MNVSIPTYTLSLFMYIMAYISLVFPACLRGVEMLPLAQRPYDFAYLFLQRSRHHYSSSGLSIHCESQQSPTDHSE